MSPKTSRLAAPIAAVALALGLAACGNTSSTGNYKGEEAKVAEVISNLQKDATAIEAKKVCKNDLSAAVDKRLEAKGSTCVKALEGQLKEIDTYSMTVTSVSVKDSSATAEVKSTWGGKEEVRTLNFVKEAGGWKLDSLS